MPDFFDLPHTTALVRHHYQLMANVAPYHLVTYPYHKSDLKSKLLHADHSFEQPSPENIFQSQ